MSFLASVLLPLFVASCGDDDDGSGNDGSPDQAGSACEAPADCYPGVDPADLAGEVQCLDRVRAGYCTHTCGEDGDCCAVEGECETDLSQVCSPFESTGENMCFLSCESGDVDAAGSEDDQAFCQEYVSPDFICRSSGGGSANRKVCVPADCGLGASCEGEGDCDPGLECLTDFDGGHCGVRDCTANADCPQDGVCVTLGDTNVCLRPCVAESDCTLCRGEDVGATCRDDVEYVETGMTPVCVP